MRALRLCALWSTLLPYFLQRRQAVQPTPASASADAAVETASLFGANARKISLVAAELNEDRKRRQVMDEEIARLSLQSGSMDKNTSPVGNL